MAFSPAGISRATDRMEAVFMKPDKPFDYIAAINQLRQEEQSGKTQIHAPDYIPVLSGEPVDYLAATRAWDQQQAGKYAINLEE